MNLHVQLRPPYHVIGCKCHSCIGRRNRRKGQRSQAKMHRRLGGEGFTPSNEESARPYTVTCEVLVMPENKTGAQIPMSWLDFIGSRWFLNALKQSSRAVPFGSGVMPAVSMKGDFVVVDIRGKK